MSEKKLIKPVKPENDDCCGGGGCCPCVWDTYFNALDLWEEQEAKEKALLDAESTPAEQGDSD